MSFVLKPKLVLTPILSILGDSDDDGDSWVIPMPAWIVIEQHSIGPKADAMLNFVGNVSHLVMFQHEKQRENTLPGARRPSSIFPADRPTVAPERFNALTTIADPFCQKKATKWLPYKVPRASVTFIY